MNVDMTVGSDFIIEESEMSMEEFELLAAKCLAHLEQEEAMLATSLKLVNDTRLALRRRDDVALEANLHCQQRLATIGGQLYAERETLRHEISTSLRITPQASTISAVARKVDEPLRSRLANRQRELRQLAIQVEATNHANQDLALRLMRLLSAFLGRLSALELSTGRYLRNGHITQHASASIYAKEC